MTLTQIRHATVKVNLQRHNSASVSTFNYGFCYPPTPSLLSLDYVAIVRTRLPRQPNPHSRARGAFREPKPAGSFLGGFRTPAAARSAPSFMAGIRNPAQKLTPGGYANVANLMAPVFRPAAALHEKRLRLLFGCPPIFDRCGPRR